MRARTTDNINQRHTNQWYDALESRKYSSDDNLIRGFTRYTPTRKEWGRQLTKRDRPVVTHPSTPISTTASPASIQHQPLITEPEPHSLARRPQSAYQQLKGMNNHIRYQRGAFESFNGERLPPLAEERCTCADGLYGVQCLQLDDFLVFWGEGRLSRCGICGEEL